MKVEYFLNPMPVEAHCLVYIKVDCKPKQLRKKYKKLKQKNEYKTKTKSMQKNVYI